MKSTNILRKIVRKHISNILLEESDNIPFGSDTKDAPWRDIDSGHVDDYNIDYDNNRFIVFVDKYKYEVSFDDFVYRYNYPDIQDNYEMEPSDIIKNLKLIGHDFADELESILEDEIRKDIERYSS